MIVVEQATQSTSPQDWPAIRNCANIWRDQSIVEALVISLGMIVGDELVNGFAQRALTKED